MTSISTVLTRRRRRHLRAVPEVAARPGRAPIAVTDGMGQMGLGLTFVVLAVILALIGSVMVLSASSVAAVEEGGSSFSVFFRQCLWLAAGLLAMFAAARTDYHRWSRWVPVLVFGSIALLLLVLVPGLGISVNGRNFPAGQMWVAGISYSGDPFNR